MNNITNSPKFHFIASKSLEAREACEELIAEYGQTDINEALTLVPLGGDGFMIETIHKILNAEIKHMNIFGMNRGSVGFLMNSFHVENLISRIQATHMVNYAPLSTQVTTVDGKIMKLFAINEVALLRQTGQSSHLTLSIDGKVMMERLIGDGVLIATPAGSTAYNYSAGGSVLPFNSPLFAITPLNCYMPKNWRGAVIPNSLNIDIEIQNHIKRPVSLSADFQNVQNIKRVSIHKSLRTTAPLLYDKNHSLSQRILEYMFR